MSSAIGDLDNDGIGDLVVGIADGQTGADIRSGWIFLSDNSGSLASGRQVPLAVGNYGLANTKHNSMTLADINDDGRLDILIGQTRAEPYYSGRSVQLLVNRGNGEFVDETTLRLAEANRPEAQGEGLVEVLDVNGDGYPDIVDGAGGIGNTVADIAIMVNDGSGHFSRMPSDLLPVVMNYHLLGNENWEGELWGIANTPYLWPIDLSGDGIVSFLVQMKFNPERWPQLEGDRAISSFYLIRSKQAYRPVSGPTRLSDIECIMHFAEQSVPEMLPDSGVETQKLDAFSYRYYPSVDTYLAIRGGRLLLHSPSQSSEIVDYGSTSQYLPAARAGDCGQ